MARPIFDLAYNWQADAACRGVDSNLFFGPQHEPRDTKVRREAQAKDICRTCPVREACLAFALETNETYGVWGGLNESERRRLAQRAG